jgi:hypothetical protein
MTVLHSERFQAELGIEVQKFAGSEERNEGEKKTLILIWKPKSF